MEPWYDEKEINAVHEYLKSGAWIMEHKRTRELGQMIANYTGAKFCSILPNGTLTLWAALAVLDIGPGDEVIVPDYTMVATTNAVRLSGAKPVFVDISRKNLCLDLELTRKAITPRTKAIMLVSINGRCPEVKEFAELAKEKNIYLIEDAAQSLGSRVDGKHLGTFGVFGSFSFSMPKVITMGQGGALITDDEEKYKKLLMFKNFGREEGAPDDYKILGYNLKFSDLQAVFGIEQMKKLEFRVNRKKEIFNLYKKLLSGNKNVEFIETSPETSPWFIDILVSDPDDLAKYLKESNVGTRRFYPSIHDLPFYNLPGDFPVSKEVARRGLWLPSASNLKDEQISYVCRKINEYYEKK
jgi:perosamine synthetase